MKQTQVFYETPKSEALVVDAEGVLCISGGTTESIVNDSGNSYSDWDFSI